MPPVRGARSRGEKTAADDDDDDDDYDDDDDEKKVDFWDLCDIREILNVHLRSGATPTGYILRSIFGQKIRQNQLGLSLKTGRKRGMHPLRV